MNKNKVAMIAIGLTALLAFSPAASFAQGTTTFSGEAVALKANVVGVSLAPADTVSATVKRRESEQIGCQRQGRRRHSCGEHAQQRHLGERHHQSVAVDTPGCSLLNGLVAATAVKSNSSASWSDGPSSVSGNAELVGLTVASQSILVSHANLSISLPGGISVIINQQTSSSGGTSGSMTANALHVTGPANDLVVASAQSDITCS